MLLDSNLAGVKAVLFDIDGTLANTLDLLIEGLGDAYFQFSGVRPPADQIRATLGAPLATQMTMFGLDNSTASLAERVDYTLSRFRDLKGRAQLYEAAVAGFCDVIQAGYSVALVTSKSQTELDECLDQFPVLRASHSTVSASDVARPKPAPDAALLACERLRVSPNEAIYVGDAVFDVECARAANVRCVAVSYGAAARSDLESLSPDWLVETPAALRDWLTTNLNLTSCVQPVTKRTPT